MGTLSKTAPELICHETGGLRICNIVTKIKNHIQCQKHKPHQLQNQAAVENQMPV
ncbi:hypothetical protein F2Q69_00014697 [Brassica cretica]|uniref:Uncharacterized protein n=1 Tax=Brassica cretica TaxID=69181 RepID=A0A8S9QW87_BRACR|nr:hypothetical protein F2Q69_00014697 [Brassica cretica]